MKRTKICNHCLLIFIILICCTQCVYGAISTLVTSDPKPLVDGYTMWGSLEYQPVNGYVNRASTTLAVELLSQYKTYAYVNLSAIESNGTVKTASGKTEDQGFIGCSSPFIESVTYPILSSSHTATVVHKTTGAMYSNGCTLTY